MDYCLVLTTHPLQRRSEPLRKVLEEIVQTRPVVLIAEETNANLPFEKQKTKGRDVAKANSIEWLPFDMTSEEQKAAGIFDALERAFAQRQLGFNAHDRSAEDVRENHWLRKIAEACNRLDIKEGTILLICGRYHGESLCSKLRDLGHKVEAMEYPAGLGEELKKLRSWS